jgi:hypothetical protein
LVGDHGRRHCYYRHGKIHRDYRHYYIHHGFHRSLVGLSNYHQHCCYVVDYYHHQSGYRH